MNIVDWDRLSIFTMSFVILRSSILQFENAT